MASTRRVPFLGVIGLRLALVAAATILLFNSVAPYLKNLGYELLDVEEPDYPDYSAIANSMAPLVSGRPVSTVDPLFATHLARVTRELASYDVAFYVIDSDGRLVYRTVDLTGVDSDILSASTNFTLTVDGRMAGFAYAILNPIARGNRRIGFFGTVSMFLSDEAREAKATEAIIALTSDQPIASGHAANAERQLAMETRYERVRQVVDVGVPIVCALVLAGLASLLVTRRLLGMVAATRAASDEIIPGPFDVRGSDEVAELARALNDMRKRNLELLSGLKQRDTSRREWVAQVSHDLRTPLTSLQVCLERVHASDPVGADPALEEAVRLARHDAERVRTLAEDLLEAARLEADVHLHIEPILPREVVQQALRSVRPLAGRDGKELVFENESSGAPPAAEVLADGARLVRACENLLRNAVRHAHSRVVVGLERRGDRLRFHVRDDGSGFGGEAGEVDLRRVGVIGESAGSSGIGLLVVERIAVAHGGRFGASNRPGGGAEVWFEIAVAPR